MDVCQLYMHAKRAKCTTYNLSTQNLREIQEVERRQSTKMIASDALNLLSALKRALIPLRVSFRSAYCIYNPVTRAHQFISAILQIRYTYTPLNHYTSRDEIQRFSQRHV
jgi:hypothetical protein